MNGNSPLGKMAALRAILLAVSLALPVAAMGQSTAADYYNRAHAKKAKGDLDGALADYTRALELDPKLADACNNRGCVKQAKGDLDGALADYTRALELDPKLAIACNNCGVANFIRRNWKAALGDFNRRCELAERDQDYPRLFIWLIRAWIGETDAANKELAAYLDKRWNAAPGDWISKVAGHLLGKVPEAELFAAAKSPDEKKERGRLCEAWFYAGMKKLLGADKSAAADYFKKCLATEEKGCVEYEVAQAELKALGQ